MGGGMSWSWVGMGGGMSWFWVGMGGGMSGLGRGWERLENLDN